MFSPDLVQARLREQPFAPLRVVTSSGQSYDVTHPELVIVGRQYLFIGLPSNENPTQAEGISRVALMYVTDLQDLPTSKSAGANGAGG